MLRLLIGRILNAISSDLFYVTWSRTSAFALTLWALSFVADDTWFVKTALITILVLLLVTGVVLLIVGMRDLGRDLRHMIHDRSHKKGHA